MNSRIVWGSALGGLVVLTAVASLMGQRGPGIPCLQGNDCSLNNLTIKGSINGNIPTAVGNVTLYVSGSGTDTNNNCQSVANPCATVGRACSLLPVVFPADTSVTVIIDAGTYTDGCFVEGRTFRDNSYISFVGGYSQVADAGSGLAMSGAIASYSAYAIGSNTYGSVVSDGGWADGGLRDYFLLFTSGAAADAGPVAIMDNTGAKIIFGGFMPIGPSANDAFSIVQPNVFFDAGATLELSPPGFDTSYGHLNAFLVARNGVAAAPNFVNFAFANNSAPFSMPTAVDFNHPFDISGNIYVQGFAFTNPSGTPIMIENSPGTVIRGNWWTNQTSTSGTTTGCLITSDGVANSVVSNVVTKETAGIFSLICSNGNNYNDIRSEGNVIDTAALFGYATLGQTGLGAVELGGIQHIYSLADSIRNVTIPAYNLDQCAGCFIYETDVENGPASNACAFFGANNSTSAYGMSGTGTIRGGTFAGCARGPVISGGNWRLRGSSSETIGGVNSQYGLTVINGAHVTVDPNAGTVTGSAGDINIGAPTDTISWSRIATLGAVEDMDTLSVLKIGSAITIAGKPISATCDTSLSPGNATCNTQCGRSAIASSASQATITNQFAELSSQIDCQMETGGTGVANIICTRAAGNFVATSINGTGVVTNVTSATTFSWCVKN